MTNLSPAIDLSTSWDRLLTRARRYNRKRSDPHRYRKVEALEDGSTIWKCGKCGRVKFRFADGAVSWSGGVGYCAENGVTHFPGRCK